MTWVLTVIYCISCGENLGIRMTESKMQDYCYCSRCYRQKLECNVDLEQSYNRLKIEPELITEQSRSNQG